MTAQIIPFPRSSEYVIEDVDGNELGQAHSMEQARRVAAQIFVDNGGRLGKYRRLVVRARWSGRVETELVGL
jgi:hypothetical protein